MHFVCWKASVWDGRVLFTDPAQRIVANLETCFLPKVRILNGIHTVMVAIFIPRDLQSGRC